MPNIAPPAEMSAGGEAFLAQAFGLRWRSDRPMPLFAAAPDDGAAIDVEVRREAALPPRPGGRRVNRGEVFADGTRFSFEGAVIDMVEGRLVRWSGSDHGAVPLAVASTVAAHLLAWRGLVPLHGSAVAFDGRAILVCGRSGAGKSTLANALIDLGGELVSDDLSVMLPVGPGDQPRLLPGRPGIRLGEDMLAKRIAARPQVDQDRPVPLALLVLLQEEAVAASPAAAASAMMAQLFRPIWMRALPHVRERTASLLHASHRVAIAALPPAFQARDTGPAERAAQALALLRGPVRVNRPVDPASRLAIPIRPEAPRALSAVQECRVLTAAVRKGSTPPTIRPRLALLLNQLDRFGETIAVLNASSGEPAFTERLLLAAAYSGRALDGDAACALEAAESAGRLAADDSERAQALVEQAGALRALGRSDAARARLGDALMFDPANREACKRLTVELVQAGKAGALLASTRTLIARGARHSGLMAAEALALAQSGRHEAARDLLGLDAFLTEGTIAAPSGWASLADFNAALAAELLASPSIRDGRHGTASVDTRRIDSLVAGAGDLARQLVDQIAHAIRCRVETLGATDHPWVRAAPRAAVLRSWCVMTDGPGYERWHMHPFGWMSGVYYVQVPEAVSNGTDASGCLMLGLSDSLIGGEASRRVGRRLVRPRPGLLASFPSHSFHRTFPHAGAGTRICVAFDVGAHTP